ncbi:MAG: VWA domain-containing protein [Deltaproteobacteria bacterium]|nr:VWA domain-containing protein [Deltaproteobacteria bacterium]
MLLLHCNQPPKVENLPGLGGSSAKGGAGGGGGGDVKRDAAAPGNDGPIVVINADVIPAWWITADAPQEPDTPPPPSLDYHCGIIQQDTVRKPADIMLVLDRSASMDYSIGDDCYCDSSVGRPVCTDTTDCKTRWESLKPAIDATLANSNNVQWGLKLFPTGSSGNCNVSDSVEVPVDDPDSITKIQQAVEDATLALSTPTAQAIEVATSYLQSLDDTNQKFILLATDGEPNCGGSPANIMTVDVDGAAAEAAAAKDAGFPVYVVGIGPNLENLTKIAYEGGTTDYYPVSSPEQLVDALSSISKVVGSCVYTSEEAPQDPENVAVYVNKVLVEKSEENGWTYGDSTKEIRLTGSYCDMIMSGEQDVSVQILFGCPGMPPFDPFLP